MPKRKLVVKDELEEDSDLSPTPANLVEDDPVANGKVESKPTGQSKKRKRNVKAEEDVTFETTSSSKQGKRLTAKKEEVEAKTKPNGTSDVGVENKPKRKRKTQEEKDADAMPLAPRSLTTTTTNLFIGAHVSGAGGVHNAPLNSVHIGANAFALFLKSQRKWVNPPLSADHCKSFHETCDTAAYDTTRHVVPHGSYLVNLAHTDKERTEQAYTSFLDDLQRCEKLGIKLYNFHPGVANSTGGDRQAAIKHLAANLNRAHKATSTVVTLLENMAAGGNVLGSTFEDLRDTIALVEDKERVGVCLDTCHAFAGGYDLREPKAFGATMEEFEEKVGFKYLRALHLNDSKAPFASHRDLHANIGTGFLGLRAFHNIVNEPRFRGLPLILETPIEVRDEDGVLLKDEKGKEREDKGIWAREIKLLESMVGMDVEGEEFLALEEALAKKGAPERKRLSEQMEKKRDKEEKKARIPKKSRKKGVGSESDDED